ncbi:hypothetical protein Tco_1298323, partial [Tanacetum coccineum]
PFQRGTLAETLAEETKGALQQGPVHSRVFTDLSAQEKEKYKADIRATNILLQGIPKDIYTLINHYTDAKDIRDNVKMILEGETIHVYYDMRNIKMTMPRMQLNSKFVNNMLPEWSRFITEVKLNRGLKESNFDQLYAYLKQHEVHANENRMMMERFIQPTNDPLALVSNASNQKYLTQSSDSPQFSNQPSLVDNYGRVVVQDVRGRYNTNNRGRPFQRNNARGNVVAGNARDQNRDGNDSDYFKDKMLLMHAHENGAILDEEQLLFIVGEQVTNFDDDVDDVALNVNHVFEDDQCDAFDSDVDEAPTTQTMFMANLTSDEAEPSYDSNIRSGVQDPEYYSDCEDKYNEVHEMQSDVQHNYVVDSDADYTSDSNIIPYDQYVEDNEENVVQSNVSSVQNDSLMLILDKVSKVC